MSLVKKAAWLDICDCGDHGRFVLSDDTYGTEFCSKEFARKELKRLHGERLIDESELRFLKDEVNSCRLPISEMDADMSAHLTSGLINEHRERPKMEHPPKNVM